MGSELFLLSLVLISVFIQNQHRRAVKKGIVEISGISKKLFSVIDVMLSKEHQLTSFIANELEYFNSCMNLISLKLHIVSRLNNAVVKSNIVDLESSKFRRSEKLIAFTEQTSDIYKTAILSILDMQIKLRAMANYPKVSESIKGELLHLSKLSPTNKVETLLTLYKIKTKCAEYRLECKVGGGFTVPELYEALLVDLRDSSCEVCEANTKKPTVVGIRNKA